MRTNEFTKRTISERLPKEIRVIEFFLEDGKRYTTYRYYQIKVEYKDTYIYTYITKEPKAADPTVEEIVKVIKNKIQNFEEIIEGEREEECIDLIGNAIRVRYYEEGFIDDQGNKMIYLHWDEELDIYIKREFMNKEKNNKTIREAYDTCIRNFKEGVSGIFKEMN